MTRGAAQRRSRRAAHAAALVPGSLNFRRFALVTCVGALSGLLIPSLGPLRQPVLVLLLLGLSAKIIEAILRRQFTLVWGVTAFLVALEPAFRTYARVLPYLMLDYVLLVCGVLALTRSRTNKSAPQLPANAYGFYMVLELTGTALAQSWTSVRAIVLPSVLLLVFLLNARRTRLSPSATTFILASYVAGAVMLAAFAFRSYLSGNITWGTESNFEASGGMPPNHLSMLLSLAVFACVVLAENSSKVFRIATIGVATVLGSLMVLTFSRGGTVLVVLALVLYYVFLRAPSRRTIFALIVIAAMGLVISYAAKEVSGGKVTARYGEQNTSNRFTIAVEGWGIYLDHPIVGVGTSNFSEAVSETNFGLVSGAHNEFVRAAAEHGTLGLVTWLLFIVSAFAAAARRGNMQRAQRGLRVVILIFATTSMFYNGLKLTMQPLLVLLSVSAFSSSDAARNPTRVDRRPAIT